MLFTNSFSWQKFFSLVLGIAIFATIALSQNPKSDLKDFEAKQDLLTKELEALPKDLNSKEWVKKKLSIMVQIDQDIRELWIKYPQSPEITDKAAKIDKENTEALKEIVHKYDWVKISEFGKEAARNAWLLVQHSTHDLPFQKDILARLEKLYPLGEAHPQAYAYLYDRVATQEQRPQRYGTQGTITPEGTWQAHEIENMERLNERREAMGMPTYEEYLEKIKEVYHLK